MRIWVKNDHCEKSTAEFSYGSCTLKFLKFRIQVFRISKPYPEQK